MFVFWSDCSHVCSWLHFIAGMDHLRCVFVKQMGLTEQDIVALSGAHTLVRKSIE